MLEPQWLQRVRELVLESLIVLEKPVVQSVLYVCYRSLWRYNDLNHHDYASLVDVASDVLSRDVGLVVIRVDDAVSQHLYIGYVG